VATDLHLVPGQSRAVPAPRAAAVPTAIALPGPAPLTPRSGSQPLLSKSPHFTGPSLCAGENLEEKLLNCFIDNKTTCSCSRRSCVRSGQHTLLGAAGFSAAELRVWGGRASKGLMHCAVPAPPGWAPSRGCLGAFAGLGLRPGAASPPSALRGTEAVWEGAGCQAGLRAGTWCLDRLLSHFLSLGLTWYSGRSCSG